MNNDFSNAGSNQSAFANAYLTALRAVIACDDSKAGIYVRQAQRALGDDEGNSTVGAIKTELSLRTLDSLYGDYQYGVVQLPEMKNRQQAPAGPWIKNQTLVAMIGRHIALLGDDTDIARFNEFAAKSAKLFNQPFTTVAPRAGLR